MTGEAVAKQQCGWSQDMVGGGGGGRGGVQRGPEGGGGNKKQVGGQKHTVHWFRKGLRLHDNPSLREGLKNATTFRCIFILDPWFTGASNVSINKWRFLLQCLEDLDNSLKKLNSRLFVVRGQPADEWGTTNLTFEEDPEPFGRVRDQNVMAICKEMGISVVSKVSHTIYRLDDIIEKNGGTAPLTYRKFQTVVASLDEPPQAEPTVTAKVVGAAVTPIADDHDEKFGVPSLDELGFDTEGLLPPVWQGGESEALARLERHLERKIKKAAPPPSLHGQLLWREFFYCAATNNSNFDRMVGNPICVQIPWTNNPEALAKWANGQTGFPWIDAIMHQLREEGWIHHLARHAVACFLTRGDLWVPILYNQFYLILIPCIFKFDELLLDADWSVNAGMWMWLSCSSFFQQFFHVYCPVRFGRLADPSGDFIRRYVPALKNFPSAYIHEPWNCPIELQKSAKCIIGEDFPLPMVNHVQASRVNMERLKQVYSRLAEFRNNNMHLMRPLPSPSGPTTSNGVMTMLMDNCEISVNGLKHERNNAKEAIDKGLFNTPFLPKHKDKLNQKRYIMHK
ncbi:hypothetical protein LSTR_LSTR007965 [Laodelphax striatellus]|uniref:Photolyase/cryptochrome alpha/beta domain-containing protein n=1 Tax=Laodelphax striatellus TaxID=195883 RepID=A0A482WHM6_LAOST|nr:hypothetical protein LSTR_LSTR007965 [Laodelphax striatellus]